MKRLLLLLCLLLAAPAVAGGDDGPVMFTHAQAEKLMARYMQALEQRDKALVELAKEKERMAICWAGWSGFKNDSGYP